MYMYTNLRLLVFCDRDLPAAGLHGGFVFLECVVSDLCKISER